jgi:hypothetical protein
MKRSGERIAYGLRRVKKRMVDPLRRGGDPFRREVRLAIHDANEFSISVRMRG